MLTPFFTLYKSERGSVITEISVTDEEIAAMGLTKQKYYMHLAYELARQAGKLIAKALSTEDTRKMCLLQAKNYMIKSCCSIPSLEQTLKEQEAAKKAQEAAQGQEETHSPEETQALPQPEEKKNGFFGKLRKRMGKKN